MPGLRVVFPVGRLHLGGGTRMIVELANGLAERGHHVRVVIPYHYPIAYALRAEVVRTREGEVPPLGHVDVVIPQIMSTVDLAAAIPATLHLRLVLGFEPLWVADRERAMATFLRPWPIACISRWLQWKVHQATGRRSFRIRPGVNPEAFRPRERRAGSRPVLFYVFRSPRAGYGFKGGDDFWEAMRLVRAARPDVDVRVVAPDGPPGDTGVPHALEVAETDEDMARLYRQTDLFVSTSWFEGFNLPVLESLACGTPVVTTDCGGIRDFVHHGRNGWIVPPRSPEDLARAILFLLDRPASLDALRRQAAPSVKGWTWHRTVDDLEALILWLLNGSRAALPSPGPDAPA